jgi:putative redox protein
VAAKPVRSEKYKTQQKGVQMAEYQAQVHYGGNDFFVGISPRGHAQVMETNGDRAAAVTPIEMLLVAIGGCTASDVVDILRKKREDLSDYRVNIHGDRSDEFPKRFTKIRLHHILKGRNLSESAIKHAIELSDSKYCGVAATLRPGVDISVSYEIIQEEVARDLP